MTSEEKWHRALDILNNNNEHTEEQLEEIYRLLNEAIEDGHAGAHYTMGILYYQGLGVKMDVEKGLALAQKALDLGYERAKLLLSNALITGEMGSVDDEKAERYLRDLVAEGHVEAFAKLAWVLLFGNVPDSDYQEGLGLLEEAVKRGDDNAYLTIAETYGKSCQDDKMREFLDLHVKAGKSVPQEFLDRYNDESLPRRRVELFNYHLNCREYDKAVSTLKDGVAAGEIQSEEKLADVYYNGIGPDNFMKDEAKAVELLNSLSERGSAYADFKLSAILFEADDEQSYVRAMSLLRRSADAGYSDAKFVYSQLLIGENQDESQIAESFRYLESAASSGNADALRILASTYLQDSEILPPSAYSCEKDEDKGVWYLQASAKLGDADSLLALVKCYRSGSHVEKNERTAFILLCESVKASPNDDNMLLMGDFYSEGVGVEKDDVAAFKFYKHVADNSSWNGRALFNVARMYNEGIGVEKDEDMANKYYDAFKEVMDYNLHGIIPLSEVKRMAKEGDPEAMHQLGTRYNTGLGVEESRETASDWWLKAAMKGHATAMHDLAMHYLLEKEDYVNGLKWLEKASDNGCIQSMMALSEAYRNGQYDLEYDPEKVMQYLSKAAELDDETAQFTMCSYYHEGHVVEKDMEKAKMWFDRFYEHRSGFCYFRKALCYLNGDMYPKDDAKAIEQLELSIKEGYEEAYGFYYDLLWCGNMVEKDPQRIVAFLEELAESGDAGSKYYLSRIYSDDDNPGKDVEKSIAFLQSAADDGHRESRCQLGVKLIQGDSVDKDVQRGFDYLELAATAGNATAMSWLGYFYLNGEECEKDMDKALRWLEAGAYHGDEYAACTATDIYRKGVEELVEKDLVKAYDIISPMADKSPRAGYLTALILEEYSMSEENYSWEMASKAFHYMGMAARAGHPDAIFNLAMYYQKGLGCRVDLRMVNGCYNIILGMDSVDEETKEHVRAAIEDAKQNSRLTRLRYLSDVVDANPDKVKTKGSHLDEEGYVNESLLLQQAAECGEAGAYEELAYRFRSEPVKALAYVCLAADNGLTWSAHHIGNLYITGDEGVEQDLSTAYSFLEVGAKAGDADCLCSIAFIKILPANRKDVIEEGVRLLNYIIENSDDDSDAHKNAVALLAEVQQRRNSPLGKLKSVFNMKSLLTNN